MVWVQLQISWQFWCLSVGHLLPRSTRRQRWRTTTSTWPSTSCSRSATSTPYDSNLILVKNNRTTVMVSRSTTTYSQNWTQTNTSRSLCHDICHFQDPHQNLCHFNSMLLALIMVSVIVDSGHGSARWFAGFGILNILLYSSFSSWSIRVYCHSYDSDSGQRS